MTKGLLSEFATYMRNTEYKPGQFYKESTIKDYINRIKRNTLSYSVEDLKKLENTLTNKDDRSAVKLFITFLEIN